MRIFQSIAQEPRFPDDQGKARKVEDLTLECKKWKRFGGCELDRDFNLTSRHPQPSDLVASNDMFNFMMRTCQHTCGWADGNLNFFWMIKREALKKTSNFGGNFRGKRIIFPKSVQK